MNPLFMMYAAESEGDIPTRRGKIQKVIMLMATSEDCNDPAVQSAIFDAVGLDSDSLTDTEIHYIEKEVASLL